MSNGQETYVSISLEEYAKLLDDAHFLNCLRNAGVDNWYGYEDAQDMFAQENGQ